MSDRNDPSNTPLLPSSNINVSRKRASWKTIVFFVLLSLLTITSISLSTVIYFHTLQDESSFESRIITLNNQLHEMQERTQHTEEQLQKDEQEREQHDHDIKERIDTIIQDISTANTNYQMKFEYITAKLIELSNYSNAEVLNKLQQTRDIISMQLNNTQNNINIQLDNVQKNVSTIIATTKNELLLTEQHVQLQLNHTIITMKSVAQEASDKIQIVQSNVTDQLSIMDMSLLKTKLELNDAVIEAQNAIHHEVQNVQDNISQYVAITNKQFAAENDFVKYQLAGTFTLLACLISLWHLTSHVRHYAKPDIQRRIMAVLWMVPIYSITSWCSLVFPSIETILSAIRDVYEAYVVYTFIALLIAILQDDDSYEQFMDRLTRHVLEENHAYESAIRKKVTLPIKHLVPPCPCCYTRNRVSSIAAAWLNQCRIMAMQFVIIKPLLTIIPYIITACGYDYSAEKNAPYRDQMINWTSARLYIIISANISVGLAFYGLLKFYHGTEKELAWCDPWPKFLCIKGVVFMTFWQGIAISAMSSLGLVDEKAALQIQNLLICIEMMIASIAHYYIFPYQEWQIGYQRHKKQVMINDTLAVKDFFSDFSKVLSKWEKGAITDIEAVNVIETSFTQHQIDIAPKSPIRNTDMSSSTSINNPHIKDSDSHNLMDTSAEMYHTIGYQVTSLKEEENQSHISNRQQQQQQQHQMPPISTTTGSHHSSSNNSTSPMMLQSTEKNRSYHSLVASNSVHSSNVSHHSNSERSGWKSTYGTLPVPRTTNTTNMSDNQFQSTYDDLNNGYMYGEDDSDENDDNDEEAKDYKNNHETTRLLSNHNKPVMAQKSMIRDIIQTSSSNKHPVNSAVDNCASSPSNMMTNHGTSVFPQVILPPINTPISSSSNTSGSGSTFPPMVKKMSEVSLLSLESKYIDPITNTVMTSSQFVENMKKINQLNSPTIPMAPMAPMNNNNNNNTSSLQNIPVITTGTSTNDSITQDNSEVQYDETNSSWKVVHESTSTTRPPIIDDIGTTTTATTRNIMYANNYTTVNPQGAMPYTHHTGMSQQSADIKDDDVVSL